MRGGGAEGRRGGKITLDPILVCHLLVDEVEVDELVDFAQGMIGRICLSRLKLV